MENNDDIQEPQVTQPTEDPIKELLQKQEEKIDRLEKAISDNKRVLIDLSKKLNQYYKSCFISPSWQRIIRRFLPVIVVFTRIRRLFSWLPVRLSIIFPPI